MQQRNSSIINIERLLKEEYNYIYDGNDEDFIKQNFIELEGNGIDAFFWFYYKGEKYLFKSIEEPEINIWGELLSCEMAEYLNIPHAEYYAAKFKNKIGIITKSIVKDNEKLILGSELFQKFYIDFLYHKDGRPHSKLKYLCDFFNIPEELLKMKPYDRQRYIFNYLNNIKCLESIFKFLLNENAKKIFNEEEINLFIKGINKTLIFDLITLQYDRHPNNWGIIKKDRYKFSELFDNSKSFGLCYPYMNERIINFQHRLMDAIKLSKFNGEVNLDSIIYNESPTLTFETSDSINPIRKQKMKVPEILEKYLNNSDETTKNNAIEMILSVIPETIENLIKKAEDKNHIKMDENLKIYILTLFDNHLSRIHDITNKYRRIQNGNKL